MERPYSTSKQISGKIVKYRLNWSPYVEMDRYLIHGAVPSEGGIFQIFVNRKGQLHHLQTEYSYYGGLRNRMRELIDPLYMGDNPHKNIIQNNQCFARYSIILFQPDMMDILHYLTGSEPSGRFEDILVMEKECLAVKKL